MGYLWRCSELFAPMKAAVSTAGEQSELRTKEYQIKAYSNAVRLLLDNQTAVQFFYKFSVFRGT